jgi:hypothetical protein
LFWCTGRPLSGTAREEAHRDLCRILDLVASAPPTCSGCSCRATERSTLNVCIDCEGSWCERCGGVTGPVPIPAFRCCHCLLKQYHLDGVLLALPERADIGRLTELLGLVRGRMLLLSQAKRATTRASYRTGKAALDAFAARLRLRPLPLTPSMVMDWAVYGLVGQTLDSSTIKVRFGAAYDIYDYARTRLGLRSLANPLRDPEVLLEIARAARGDYRHDAGHAGPRLGPTTRYRALGPRAMDLSQHGHAARRRRVQAHCDLRD